MKRNEHITRLLRDRIGLLESDRFAISNKHALGWGGESLGVKETRNRLAWKARHLRKRPRLESAEV